jgi:hypothetical protein
VGPDRHTGGAHVAVAAGEAEAAEAGPSNAAQASPGGISAQRRFLAAALQNTPLPLQQVCACLLCLPGPGSCMT